MAPGRAEIRPPPRLRGFHRGRRGSDPPRYHEPAPARHHGRFEWRPPDGGHADAAAGSVPRHRDPGAAPRHAALSQAARRRLVDAEYGDPDIPDEAAFLKRISPYHNLKPG